MIEAVGFRVLVEKDDIETETEAGIIIVSDEKLEKHAINTGTVVSMGKQAFKAYSSDYTGTPWVAPGDKVVFSRHAGSIIVDPYTDKEYTILNDDDIAAIIREEK